MFADGGRGSLQGLAALAQADERVRSLAHPVDILLDEDGADPGSDDVRHGGIDVVDHDGGEAERDLVEQDEVRVRHERAADGDHLLLSAGERQRGLVAFFLKNGKEPVELAEIPMALAPMVGCEAKVFLNRERAEQAAALRHHGKTEPGERVRRRAADGLAILLGTAFSLGKDPFALYGDKAAYQTMLDEVTEKLIACKDNVKTYWNGGDDLSTLLLSGEVVVSEAWDSTAFKLYGENKNLVYVPPETGALAWIDTFVIPRKGEADDAAYKWINFVMKPEIVKLMSDSTGAIAAVSNGIDLLPDDKKAAVKAAFDEQDLANLKFFANIPAGLEDMEGKALERIKAATSN